MAKLATKQRKQKLALPPGKGITANELQDARNRPSDPKKKKERAVTKDKLVKPNKQKRARSVSVTSSESSSASVPYAGSDDSLPRFSTSEDEDDPSPEDQAAPSSPPPDRTGDRPVDVGDFVIVTYAGRRYPGKILAQDAGEFEVSCMEKKGSGGPGQKKWTSSGLKTPRGFQLQSSIFLVGNLFLKILAT